MLFTRVFIADVFMYLLIKPFIHVCVSGVRKMDSKPFFFMSYQFLYVARLIVAFLLFSCFVWGDGIGHKGPTVVWLLRNDCLYGIEASCSNDLFMNVQKGRDSVKRRGSIKLGRNYR